MKNQNLKRSIMLRIYGVYALRQLSEPVFLRSAAFGALLIAFISAVSVTDVLWNAWSSVANGANPLFFFSSAFAHSLFMVKVAIVGMMVLGLVLAKDLMSRLQFSRLTYRA